MTTERKIQNDIRGQLSHGDTRLFRQQAGEYWTGDVTQLTDGSVLIRNPRRVQVGFPGLSDLGGWRSVEILPSMVGQKIAVYVAIEVKGPKGRVSEHQKWFIEAVTQAGGIAGVARSVEQAADLLYGAARA